MFHYMKKRIVNICVCLGFLIFLGPVQTASAAELDANSRFVIELINWIRLDPITYAESLGYNRDALIEERPWLADLLENQLPMLNIASDLDAKAALLNAAGYTGEIPEPGILQDYARTGEISGVVSFNNFMDPKSAIRVVVNNRFKSELADDFTGQRCILSADLNLAGAAFEAGARAQASGNIYSVTAALGSSLLKSQRQILNLINQVRANPYGAGAYLFFNLGGHFGESPPLFFNGMLGKFVKTDYVNSEYYALHAKNFGYDGYGLNRSSAIEVFPKTNVDSLVFWIFSSLVLNEAKGLTAGNVMFGQYFNEAGIGLQVANGTSYDYARLTLVTGLGNTTKPGYSRIYGLVYADGNLNGAYTPGEGVKNRLLILYDRQAFAKIGTAITDNTGYFSATLPSHRDYIIQTGSEENLVGKDIYLGNGDGFFDLRLDK